MKTAQEIEEIHNALATSEKEKRGVILTLAGEKKTEYATGTVLMFMPELGQVKLVSDNPFAEVEECIWIPIRNITKARLSELGMEEIYDYED